MWRSALDGPIAAGGAVTGDILYIGTLAKHLYAVRVGDGRILWREEVGGRVRTPPIIAGGRLIVATDDRSVTAFGPGEP
jgi:outer membrane protein assembly factor BamB